MNDLITKAQQQLDEHKAWLRSEIGKLPITTWVPPEFVWSGEGMRAFLVSLADQIKLNMVKVSGRVASVVYEYPDELYRFLKSEIAPKHLRDSLAGGHVVDPSQRTFTATREVEP